TGQQNSLAANGSAILGVQLIPVWSRVSYMSTRVTAKRLFIGFKTASQSKMVQVIKCRQASTHVVGLETGVHA
ncbi:MAG: hypothetical protein ACF8AM_11595, partial [Rhodopirellula sp. JB055]|uniref:hypothetical protein n=1 Tax=Rhodopirellula sp. JB055 TaxID=3342846 RepID=UPI00370A5F2B